MDFRTIVDVPRPDFAIGPQEKILCVGSCFADSIGRRFAEEKFRATVNPFGVMYNPASILHTVERTDCAPRVAFFTLGTNHVYILNETGEIVDNCRKRPQRLFTERELTVDECIGYLRQAVDTLANRNPEVQVVITVSPIRYAKYGYHGSQLSKAVLLMAADWMARMYHQRQVRPPSMEIRWVCSTAEPCRNPCRSASSSGGRSSGWISSLSALGRGNAPASRSAIRQ